MQVCDFCGGKTERGDNVTVRRFRLELRDINPKSHADPFRDTPEMWFQKSYWWDLDMCAECIKPFVKTLDNLVVPEDENPSRIVSKRDETQTNVRMPEK